MNITYRPFENLQSQVEYINTITKDNMHEYAIRHWGEWKDDMHDCRNKKETPILIYANNQLAGYYSYKLKKEFTVLAIEQLQIHKNFQRKGIGTQVLNNIIEFAQRSNISAISIHVFEDNPAIRLYERAGFNQISTKNATVEMELTLPLPK